MTAWKGDDAGAGSYRTLASWSARLGFDLHLESVDAEAVTPWRCSTLGQITDGQAAWDQFISGVQQTFERNASSLPVLGAVVALVLVMWLNLRLARWIVRVWDGRGRASPRKR